MVTWEFCPPKTPSLVHTVPWKSCSSLWWDGKKLTDWKPKSYQGSDNFCISLAFPCTLFCSFSICEKLLFLLSKVEFQTRPLGKPWFRASSLQTQYPEHQCRSRAALPPLQAGCEPAVLHCWEKGKYLIRLYKQCRKGMKWSYVKIQRFSFKKDLDLLRKNKPERGDWKNCSLDYL